ncbi:hypothetical protein PSTT_08218, partial [Puccinia striiformis]
YKKITRTMLPTLDAGKGSNSQLSEHLLCIIIHIVIHCTPDQHGEWNTYIPQYRTEGRYPTVLEQEHYPLLPSNKRSPSSDNTSEPLSNTDAVMTSDYSEFSGSDDEPFSPPSDDDSDSSKLDDNKSPLSPKDRRLKKLLVKIFKAGHQGPAAIRILLREHDITISPRHLARKRKEWNLQKRLNLREMNARLYADTGVEVGHHTVQRYLKKLGLTLLPNDILDGKVTMDQVYNAIHDARNNLLQNNTGYCRMRMVLMRHYNIRVPRLLFLFLWIPVFQASVDIWVDSYNHYRKRFDKLTTLPTGCTPDFAYTTPESFGTTDQLVRIPSQHIDCLSKQFYPDKEEMFLHTPLEFHEVASSVVAQLGFHFLRIDFGNVWIVFHHMLPYVQEQYVLYTDSSDA